MSQDEDHVIVAIITTDLSVVSMIVITEMTPIHLDNIAVIHYLSPLASHQMDQNILPPVSSSKVYEEGSKENIYNHERSVNSN